MHEILVNIRFELRGQIVPGDKFTLFNSVGSITWSGEINLTNFSISDNDYENMTLILNEEFKKIKEWTTPIGSL